MQTAASAIAAAQTRAQKNAEAAALELGGKRATASLAGEFESEIENVSVDAMVVLKIVKQAKTLASSTHSLTQNLPCGQLLGLDYSGTLQVSDCFGLPANHIMPPADLLENETYSRDGKSRKDDIFDVAANNASSYTAQLLPRLAELNADANIVGFYIVSSQGQFAGPNGALVEALARYQLGTIEPLAATTKPTRKTVQEKRAPGKGIALVYDASSSDSGTVALKAYRLTDAYLAVHRAGRFDSNSLADGSILPADILREYPLTIQRSSLLDAFLASTASASSAVATPSFDSLALPSTSPSSSSSLSQPLQSLLISFDASVQTLSNLRFKDRRDYRRDQKAAVGEGYSDMLKSIASSEQAASRLGEASGMQISRLYATKAAFA